MSALDRLDFYVRRLKCGARWFWRWAQSLRTVTPGAVHRLGDFDLTPGGMLPAAPEPSFVRELKFLLSQAPMQNAPETRERAAHSVTAYAYVHPKTFAKFAGNRASMHTDRVTFQPYFFISPSPTRWVVTSLMPEGGVIFTPNAMPGIEKILAG